MFDDEWYISKFHKNIFKTFELKRKLKIRQIINSKQVYKKPCVNEHIPIIKIFFKKSIFWLHN